MKKDCVHEGLFSKYKILGTIVQIGEKYNILGKDNQPMLEHDYISLKRMLCDIAAEL